MHVKGAQLVWETVWSPRKVNEGKVFLDLHSSVFTIMKFCYCWSLFCRGQSMGRRRIVQFEVWEQCKHLMHGYGHKKCLYYCPQSANSIAWVCPSVFVLDCYCLAIQYCTCPVRSRLCGATETFIFYFTKQKRNYRWLGKTFGRAIPICTSFLFPAPPPFRVPFTFAPSPLFPIFPTIWEPGTG